MKKIVLSYYFLYILKALYFCFMNELTLCKTI